MEGKAQQKRNREEPGSFLLRTSPCPPLAAFSTSPSPEAEAEACPAQTRCPCGVCTQCSRAHSPSPCPQAERWQQPASRGPLSQGTAHAGTLQRWGLTQQGCGERSKAPLPARASPELPYSPTQGHPRPPALSLGPQASGPLPPWPTVRPSSGTFLQRLSLAWGEDRSRKALSTQNLKSAERDVIFSTWTNSTRNVCSSRN